MRIIVYNNKLINVTIICKLVKITEISYILINKYNYFF